MLRSISSALAIANGNLSAFHPDAYRADLLSFKLLGKQQVVVNRPNLMRRVMLDEERAFPKHPALGAALGPLVGNGVFVSQGEHWAMSRAAFNDWLDGATLRDFYVDMQIATGGLLERLDDASKCDVDVEGEMTHVTADIIHRSIFGCSITPSMLSAVKTSFARFRRASQSLFPSLLLGIPDIRRPFLSHTLNSAGGQIRAAAKASLNEYLKMPDTDRGLISYLQRERLRRALPPLGEEELVDEVVVVLLAGHETSAAALTWAFLMLARHPDWQSKVHRELDVISQGEPISLATLSKLTCLRNVFRETLRLMPPIPLFPRHARETCQFAGRSYPKGTSLVVCPWLIHRHENTWASANQFNPARFSDPAQKKAFSKAYIPFGLGPRACPGAGFALQEATLILAEVLRRYQVSSHNSHPVQPKANLTLRPPSDLQISFQARS